MSEFKDFDKDIADDTPQLPPAYAPIISAPPKSREMEDIRKDAEIIMGVSPSLGPIKAVSFDEDVKMGG